MSTPWTPTQVTFNSRFASRNIRRIMGQVSRAVLASRDRLALPRTGVNLRGFVDGPLPWPSQPPKPVPRLLDPPGSGCRSSDQPGRIFKPLVSACSAIHLRGMSDMDRHAFCPLTSAWNPGCSTWAPPPQPAPISNRSRGNNSPGNCGKTTQRVVIASASNCGRPDGRPDSTRNQQKDAAPTVRRPPIPTEPNLIWAAYTSASP